MNKKTYIYSVSSLLQIDTPYLCHINLKISSLTAVTYCRLELQPVVTKIPKCDNKILIYCPLIQPELFTRQVWENKRKNERFSIDEQNIAQIHAIGNIMITMQFWTQHTELSKTSLKTILRDDNNNISFISKANLMRSVVISISQYACEFIPVDMW